MLKFETFWRLVVTGLAMWRLTRVFFGESGGSGLWNEAGEDASAVRFWAVRISDAACWISIWMSSQTAVWVAGGFAGLFLSWLVGSGIVSLLARPVERLRISLGNEMPGRPCGGGMRANHG